MVKVDTSGHFERGVGYTLKGITYKDKGCAGARALGHNGLCTECPLSKCLEEIPWAY